MFQLLAIWFALVGVTDAYSSGAPTNACFESNMIPLHGPSPQTSASPFNVTISSTSYTPGNPFTVTLKGAKKFKGFLILALPTENEKGNALGSFDISGSNMYQDICNGGLTHTSQFSSAGSDNVELTWNAPDTAAGYVTFYVTFVENKATFWAKVPSSPVWDGQSSSPKARPVTTSPSLSDPTPIDAIVPKGCGSDKGCYSDCKNNECGFLLTWKKASDNKVNFELFAALNEEQNYVALGISDVDKMEKVSIIACTADPNTKRSQVQQFYAEGEVFPSPQDNGPINSDGSAASIKSEDNVKSMSCRFTYDNSLAKSMTDKWKDLDQEFFAFIARGGYQFGSLEKHTVRPNISPEKIKFLSEDYKDIGGTRVAKLIKAHACIMVLAWVFCASVGLILARYYKPMWSNTKACGQKVWFSYHRALMLCAMFLTIIGFILILVQNNGEYRLPTTLPTKAHPILGLIAIICALLNPLIAAFRCHPGDDKRPIFNWAHWFFGTVAHVFAIVTIFLGMLFSSASVPGWITYIMMAFCLFHVCVEFILEIHQCCMYDKNRDRQEEYQMSNKGGSEPQYAGRGFKCAMLIIYMIVVTLITIALVAIIAVWGSVEGTATA